MKLTIAKDIDDLSSQAADWIISYLESLLKKKDLVTIVLPGGDTPEKLYQLLASPAYKKKIDWEKLHFFWGDERFVPITDKRNNARMALVNLLDHVPVSAEQVHLIRTDINPEDSCIEYENLLRGFFPDNHHSFDLVLLGMGNDAHTLSLFPGHEIIHEKKNWVRTFFSAEEKIHRITLTAPVVNRAERVAFLVSGGKKAAALFHVLTAEYNPDQYPAQIIQPFNDELYWWVDKAAAADMA